MNLKNLNPLINKFIEVHGWSRLCKAMVSTHQPKNLAEIKELIKKSNKSSLISRGSGRSYGDSAQISNSSVIDLSNFKTIIVNKSTRLVRVGAGVVIEELLNVIIPQGFFLPITPGTRKITIGGAIAADVHGKNHRIDGSFGNYIHSILLVDGKGNLRRLSPLDKNKSERVKFWATIGGMGLTGVIIEAKIRLIPITTTQLNVVKYRLNDINSIMDKMITNERNYKYNVAWIDYFNSGFRGILNSANHLENRNFSNKSNNLIYHPMSLLTVPSVFPGGLINKFTVRVYNYILYNKNINRITKNRVSLNSFFYPLDAIQNWNYLYGSHGLIQYQFVIPDYSSFFIKEALNILRKASIPAFLVVLKRFGKGNPGLLSFPKAGWSLAVDMPANIPNIYSLLDKLDSKLVAAGGRIYLAKDIRQSPEIFRASYPALKKWKAIKKELDPRCVFMSDLGKRLKI